MSEPQASRTFNASAVVERSGSPAVMYGMNATFTHKTQTVEISKPIFSDRVERKRQGKSLTLPCFLSSLKVSARPRVGEEVERAAMGANLLKEREESGEEWRIPIWGFGEWRKQTPDLKAIAIEREIMDTTAFEEGRKGRECYYINCSRSDSTLG